ncbi:MAG: type II secretion system protein GspC [Gammaproteobacteria bacterium]
MQLSQVIDWLQGPRAEQAARLVALLLGVWVLYRMATLVWLLVPTPPLTEAPVEVPSTAPEARRPRLDIAEVVNWHLFGAAAAPTAAPGAGAPIDAPDTRLNLVLRGVLSSGDPEQARAIIAEPNGIENFFRVGSTLPGGAELKEIYPDRIILLRAGRHETLRLPIEAVGGMSVAAPPETSRRGAPGGEDIGGLLGHYRDEMEASGDPQALFDLVRAVPHVDDEGFAGFRLFPGNKPELFAQLGLQPGDLVREVNGVVLDNPMRVAELRQGLADVKQFALRIDREGQDIYLTVDIP